MKNHAALLGLFCMACTSPDKLIGDSNVFADPSDIPEPEPSDPPTEASVSLSQIQSGAVPEGTLVTVTDIVATTGSSDEGFFAGTTEGGANSGIWIQADAENKGAFEVLMGQTVTVTGIVAELVDNSPEQNGEDNTLTAIVVQTAGGVVITNEATDSMPPAFELDMEILMDPISAEQYEGTYIRLSNPSMDQVGENMIVNGALPFDETFVSFADQYYEILSSPIEFVKGIVGYKDGQYVLYPCTESDLGFAETIPATTEINGTNFYISEVLAYNFALEVCNNGFHWYLELNYIHSSVLDVGTVYLEQSTPDGTFHAKLSSSEQVDPNDILLISDGDMTNCLSACDGGAFKVLTMETVSGAGAPIPDVISPGNEIALFYAPTEADYISGNRILIDSIEISYNALNTSTELAPMFDGVGTDGMSVSSGEWCESQKLLYLTDGTTISDGVGLPVYGSPGTITNHCLIGPDTATQTQ